jgi:murein DD-endopeptidase MepM/ murein hydrolase activator NlpD
MTSPLPSPSNQTSSPTRRYPALRRRLQRAALACAVLPMLAVPVWGPAAAEAETAPSATTSADLSTATSAEASATTTSAAHPFSDPTYLPLRSPAKIGCANLGCDNATSAHKYWAVDFLGAKGDPIYAAGAGIAHIGGNVGGCADPSGAVERGRWVWVDHGGGVVSQYRHLDSIAITNGQLVTPATRLGSMGSSGDKAPCTTIYLHFEVRHGGLKGPRVHPGELTSCTPAGPVTLPAIFGASSWDDPKVHPRPRLSTPAASSSCVTPTWLSSPTRPTSAASRGNRSATVTWSAGTAGGTDAATVLETYHPSTKAWGFAASRTVAASTRKVTFTGLENGRTYRATVSVRNKTGWSLPSAAHTVIPAAAPAAPRSPRYLTWPRAEYVHYGWYRPANNGSVVTSFNAARRCATKGGTYGAWKSYRIGVADAYVNFRGLSAYRSCQVKVQANNAVGAGAWSTTSTIKR